jgi:lysophospholipase L1-like esterase
VVGSFRSLFSALLAVTVLSLGAHAQVMSYTGTWGTAPMGPPAGDAGARDVTLREIAHVSVGSGQLMSVTLSNEFGHEPLSIGEAAVAKHARGNGAEDSVPLLFSGKSTVVILPGTRVTSDPVHFEFPALSDVVVSLFIPAQNMTALTQHIVAHATNYIAPGNQVTAKTLTDAKTIESWRYLRGVEVSLAENYGTIVCLGDSITDGVKSTENANHRWPDLLATRLHARQETANLGVMNEGIGGNRILRDVVGQSALARFDRDVLANANVRFLVIFEGINDIGHAYDPNRPFDSATVEELVAGYHLLIVRAHAHGIKVFGATLTPYVGAGYSSPEATQSDLS